MTGSSKVPDDYIIVTEGPFAGVTGFRLELLLGPNGYLGFGGPVGLGVHISEFEVLSYPPPDSGRNQVPVPLAHATSTIPRYGMHQVSELIDGHERGGSFWTISAGLQYKNQSAVVCPTTPITSDGLVFEFMHNTAYWHEKMQRFRISYTADPSPTVKDPSIRWMVIRPDEARFEPSGPSAKIQADGTIEVDDAEKVEQCSYFVRTSQRFENVTGFKLEVLVGDGSTLGFPATDGTMALSEWKVLIPGPQAKSR
ncbi:MAG: hypothetical protein U1D30_16135 [Planctomycetota bacterium]